MPTDWLVRNRPGSSTTLERGRALDGSATTAAASRPVKRRRDLAPDAGPGASAASFSAMVTNFLLAAWERMPPQGTSGSRDQSFSPPGPGVVERLAKSWTTSLVDRR